MNAEARRIVITGVSRGLGRALVERFVERGHAVAGCARNAAAVEELGSRHGAPHDFQVLDVSDGPAVTSWARRLGEGFGIPDLLLNNAALMNEPAPLWEVPAPEFDALLRVNVSGTHRVLSAFLPAMVAAGRGVVVNFSSGWGRSTSPEVGPYCATKWAIEGLTQSLASELPPGLAAVSLNPGIIDTDMLRQCWAEDAASYPDAEAWSHGAAERLLALGPADNGRAHSL